MTATDEFAARYMAVWNEPDAAARDAAVARPWSADARACTSANEYVGLDVITRRVTATYEKFVAGQGFVFRQLGPVEAHHDGMWHAGKACSICPQLALRRESWFSVRWHICHPYAVGLSCLS